MINVPENELFSAYLDGELTVEEQARVEQLLATSPAARQLLDELRTLSAGLQSLPPQRLEEDLSDRVLREAERRILAGGPSPRRRSDADANGKPARQWRLRRFLSPRTFLWSALAIAVAVMVSLQQQPAEQERVARAPEQAPRTQPSIQAVPQPSEIVGQPEPETASEKSTAAAEPAAASPAEEPPRPSAAALAADQPGEFAPPEAASTQPMPEPVLPPAEAIAEEAPAVEAPAAAMVEDATLDEPAPEPDVGKAPPVSALAVEEPAPAAQAIEAESMADRPPTEPEQPAASPESLAGEPAPAEAAGAEEASEEDSDEPKAETLIVRCEVSPAVLEQKLFEQILAEQKVAVVETPAAEDDEAEAGPAVQLSDASEVQTYYVEVTSQQIAAVMKDLRSRPDEFRSFKAEANRALAAGARRGASIGGLTVSPGGAAGRATIRLGPSAAASKAAGGDAASGTVGATPSTGGSGSGITPKAGGGLTFRANISVKPAPSKADAPDKKQPAGKKPRPKTFRVRFVLKAADPPGAAETPATLER